MSPDNCFPILHRIYILKGVCQSKVQKSRYKGISRKILNLDASDLVVCVTTANDAAVYLLKSLRRRVGNYQLVYVHIMCKRYSAIKCMYTQRQPCQHSTTQPVDFI